MKTEKTLVEGLERLGMMAAQIRRNGGYVSQIEADIILEELRGLYVATLAARSEEKVLTAKPMPEGATGQNTPGEARAAAIEAARKAEEEAARKKAAEEEAARKKAAEEEAARKKAAEEETKPVFAPETAGKTEEPIMEPIMESIEGNRNDDLFHNDTDEDADGKKKEAKGGSLFDYLSTESREEKPTVRTLADTLNTGYGNVEEQLERKVNAKKVDDLRTIININDKFSFMSELFHNNMKAYNDFILRLNATVDRQQALNFVQDVATQYNWNSESLVVKSFYKIFDRKF